MAFASTFLLIIVLIIRPQEIWPWMNALHLLDVLTATTVLGVAYEFFRGDLKSLWTPQIPFLLAFVFACYFTAVFGIGFRQGITAAQPALFAAIFMLIVAYGAARSVERIRLLFALLVTLGAFVGAVAIHQGRQEASCLEVDPRGYSDLREDGVPDGRSCDTRADCVKGGRGEVDYECEKLGLFKTVSIGQRVRWRGQLDDPNELSVFLGALLPFVLALASTWRKGLAVPLILVIFATYFYAVILSKSRGGQVVVSTVFAVYFYRRFGIKGLIVAAIFALPVVLLGGREGEGADSSADERRDILYDAITAVKEHPVFGQGIGVFAEERGMTAHNAYVLAAADMGVPGFYIWAGLLWTSIKMPLALVRRPPANVDPRLVAVAQAIVVSFFAMSIGIFFLSFTYKQLLFIWIGLSGAIYGAVKKDHPEFEVGMGWKDLIGVGIFTVGILCVVFGYTRLHPP
jgi:hypothetical protein